MTDIPPRSPLHPRYSARPGDQTRWGRLYGSSFGLLLGETARAHNGPVVVVTTDTATTVRLDYELRFYIGKQDDLPVHTFPDWETLPYDVFSPHQDIISERLSTLYKLPHLQRGVLLVPITTLMARLAPRAFLDAHSLMLDVGQKLDLAQMRTRLQAAGYQCVSTVYEHGEYAVRGSLLDLYPMGSRTPYRIDLFDDEIEQIRSFDPETQRSLDKVTSLRLLPAREFPLDEQAIARFRHNFRVAFDVSLHECSIYRDVSKALAPAGIEYYLPLFFEQTSTLFDYLPDNALVVTADDIDHATEAFWGTVSQRYESHRHNIDRPLLPPGQMFLPVDEVYGGFKRFPRVRMQHFALDEHAAHGVNYATGAPTHLTLDPRAAQPTAVLKNFLDGFNGRVLFAAETTGRRESLLEMCRGCDLHPAAFDDWTAFLKSDAPLGITVAPLDQGLLLEDPAIAVIAETQLFGEHAMQRRRRKKKGRDPDAVVSSLAELTIGAPVVHEDNGVGRYIGLQKLKIGNVETEFLTLEYADKDKLYVPVSSLHLISRYTGMSPDAAPLHKLGSGQWEKARRKAAEKARDVAAELLDIYARRAARVGYSYRVDDHYRAFAATFPFEETPDQEDAINAVLDDMKSDKPMDRLVCGDVGFGKTEVALRAAFVAVHANKQVAILVPTTLLAQQHYQNFKDRFADWPFRIESMSRFSSKKEQDVVLKGLEAGTVDIVIGTHKLIQPGIKFKNLGLVIIDEEHRFGVRQKDRFKALRAEVDVLTLTATPIPRTLNMSMSKLRDLSIIATPPARRLAIKTFVTQWNDDLLKEACQRELKRGGQVYFVHNDIATIEKTAHTIEALAPEATVRFAHGQMPERDLERTMLDFYHQRFNVLVCTTIIETGIDVPQANTLIVDRADHFGLAQLYQLRGRVGRSHHQAYAYLIVPPRAAMTADAIKRLEAIESIHDLGTGFTLATHDMEIRGAGELLGEEQSGQMQEIGYSLYLELLERAVQALKTGRQPELDRPLDHGTEVDLGVPALIPDDYLPDVHARLMLYKRIASAHDTDELRELQVEMIDRFGLLPDQTKNLFRVTELKLKATPLGLRKIEVGPGGGRFIFNAQPNVDARKIITLIQKQPKVYKLDGSDKLKMTRPMPEAHERFQNVEQLLDVLTS